MSTLSRWRGESGHEHRRRRAYVSSATIDVSRPSVLSSQVLALLLTRSRRGNYGAEIGTDEGGDGGELTVCFCISIPLFLLLFVAVLNFRLVKPI